MQEQKKMNPAFVFVIGFGVSGIGKGTTASSIGLILQAYGIRTTAIKIDPYLNIDPGTISPHEHGEVYVLDDGTECDLDLGNYERFMNIKLTKDNSITTGQIYKEVIQRERDGKYLGKTVQIVPHITDHIEERILQAANIRDNNGNAPEVVIVELGGTVGDMESEPYLYTIAHFHERTKFEVCILGIGLLIKNNGEYKTKLLQQSVQELRRHFITPDVLCVRCDMKIENFSSTIRDKISSSCHVKPETIMVSGIVNSIYEVPKMLHEQRIQEHICKKIGMLWRGTLSPNFSNYNMILSHLNSQLSDQVNVAIIAKYTGTPDTYLSLIRALEHAAFSLHINLKYEFINAEDDAPIDLTVYNRILVPGGFGTRGIPGKLRAIEQARKAKIPFLGICLGMQLFVIEHCISMGFTDANSTEFDATTTCPVVRHLSSYGPEIVKQLGGTMRLGSHPTTIASHSRADKIYDGSRVIYERHRHRYEVDALAVEKFRGNISFTGWFDEHKKIPDIVESTDPDWWAVSCQFHPEFNSSNSSPNKLFVAFLKQ